MSFDATALYDLERAFARLPPVVASLLVLATATCLALLVHRAAFRLLSHVVAGRDLFWRSLGVVTLTSIGCIETNSDA